MNELEMTKMQYLGRDRHNKRCKVKIFEDDESTYNSAFKNMKPFKHMVVGQIFFAPKSKDDTGWFLSDLEYGEILEVDSHHYVSDEIAKKHRTQKTVANKFDKIGKMTLDELREASWALSQEQKAQLIGLITSRILY